MLHKYLPCHLSQVDGGASRRFFHHDAEIKGALHRLPTGRASPLLSSRRLATHKIFPGEGASLCGKGRIADNPTEAILTVPAQFPFSPPIASLFVVHSAPKSN